MAKNITKDTVLADILKLPNATDILSKHKVPCLFCPMAAMEADKLSIGEIAKMYGLDLKTLLKDLNA